MNARRGRRWIALTLILTAGWFGVHADTSGVVEGVVVGPGGAPLPGVTVTAASPGSGTPAAGAVTAADGGYRISGLIPAGDYLVAAELPGYARVETAPVEVKPGAATRAGFTLVPSTQATDSVTVVGSGDVIDLASTKTATVFNSEFLDGLPILGRSYQDVLTLAPGVTDVDGDGNPNINGSRSTEVQTRVNGANVTDPLTGTFGHNLNLDAVAEMEVISTGAPAEYGNAQGGYVNVQMKSGTNELQGSFRMYFRSNLFDNDGVNNNDLTDEDLFSRIDGFNDFRGFLTLSGPIVRDRLWYIVSLQRIRTQTPTNNLLAPSLRTQEGWSNYAQITWQPTSAHRIALEFNQDPLRVTGDGLSGRTAPESDYLLEQGGYTAALRWTYNISPSALLETSAYRFDTSIDVLPVADRAPCLVDELGRCDPFTEDVYRVDEIAGTTRSPYFQTSRDQRLRHALRSDLSLFLDGGLGSHMLKTGFEYARERYENELDVERQRFDRITSGSGGLAGGATGDTIIFQDWYPGGQVREAERDQLSLYVQDSWKPIPNVSINLGLRYDLEAVSSQGFEPFDPAAQAEEFLRLYSIGNGIPYGSVGFQEAFEDASVLYDVNGDGRDSLHCSPYDLDGSMPGDDAPDGNLDDFYTYWDGDFDGSADPDNPADMVLAVPDGLADGNPANPMCDRASGDGFAMLSVFSRHQFDESAAPFEFVIDADPGRGLPGAQRNAEDFTITNGNLAPRLSVSWDPAGNNRNKIFASWGRTYGSILLGAVLPERGPDRRSTVYDPGSRSQGADATPIQTGRFSVTQVDRNLESPYTDELSFGYEREIAPEWLLSVRYVRKRARRLLQDVDLNHYTQDLNGDGILDDYFGFLGSGPGGDGDEIIGGGGPGATAVSALPDGQPDLYTYNPFFNQVLRVGNENSADYTSYQLELTRRLSRNWQMTGSYVWSKAIGDAEQYLTFLGNDPGTAEDERGYLSHDQTHRIVFSATTHLPRNQVLGGTVEWASGMPYSYVRRQFSADSFGSFQDRMTYPTGQRNDQRNEPQWTVNLLYRKHFRIGKVNAAVGVEVANLLHSDDLTVNAYYADQFLGLDSDRRFGRRWQLSGEFHF